MTTNEKKTCKSCGTEVASNVKFCPSCGAPIQKKSYTFIIVLCAAIVAAVIGFVVSMNKKEEDVGQTINIDLPFPPATTTADTKMTIDPSIFVDPVKSEFEIGDVVESNGIRASLVSVTENRGSQYNKPNEGNVYVLCEFEIENASQAEIGVSSIMSFNAYCDDYTTSLILIPN